MQRGPPECSCRSHAPPPRGAHFRPQGRSGMQAVSLHQPAAASGRRDCARIAAQVRISGASLRFPQRPGRPRGAVARCSTPPSALRPPAATRVPPIPGPWPSGVRPSRSRSACLGSGSCSATSPKGRRSGSRRLGPANGRGTRGPWRSLRLRPASDAAAGTAARSGNFAAAWSRESHLPASRRNPGAAEFPAAASGWRARAAEPTRRKSSPVKSFGSTIHSITGGTLYHLLIWQLLKM